MTERVAREHVIAKASEAAFGRPLVNNVLRGMMVEAIVALAIEPTWRWCGGDWGSWDFERPDGLRLEVKQSSYRQTWAPPAHGRVSISFDVRERVGRYEGAIFVPEPGRAAHLYVFALHDVRDDTADHRDPSQWQFFVVPTTRLPATKRLSLLALSRLAVPVRFDRLFQEIQEVASPILPQEEPAPKVQA